MKIKTSGSLGKRILAFLRSLFYEETDSPEVKTVKVVSYTVLTVIAVCILLSSILFSALFEERETVSVPNVVGMTLDEAMETMQNHFLRVKINRVNTEDLTEKGVVVSQTKTPGSVVKVDYTVVLNVGKGPVSDKITDFSGWDIDDVEPFLKAYQSQLTLLYPLSYVVNNRPRVPVLLKVTRTPVNQREEDYFSMQFMSDVISFPYYDAPGTVYTIYMDETPVTIHQVAK